MRRVLSTFLIIVIICNFIIFGLMSYSPVKAGLWEDNKDGIMTVIKGFLMLWIMNLIRENVVNDSDNIITSTIKKGLNIGGEDSPGETKVEIEEVKSTPYLTKEEQLMLDMVNEVRENEGIVPLQADNKLTEVARMKARDMLENDYFDHHSPVYGSPFAMLQEKKINYLLAGENLARAKTVEEAFKGLMESREHRGNIVDNRYDSIGIGIIKEDRGVLTVVQLFTDSPDILK